MMPILQVGPLAIQLPGLLLLLGVWLGSLTLDRQAARRGLSADRISKLVFYALLVGLAGARLGYALRHASAYLDDPLGLLALQPQTLSGSDGLLAASIFGWIYGRRAGLPLWPTLDALAPMAAILAVFVGLAHVASGDAFGAPAEVAWAVDLWGDRRHPSQVYEVVTALGVLAAVRGWSRRSLPEGVTFLAFVALSAAARLMLEAFRGDSVLIVGGLRLAQVASLILLLAALEGFRRQWARPGEPAR